MMKYVLIALTTLLLLISSQTYARVYKCTLADGSVIFSDKVCASDAERYEINEAYKPDPTNLYKPKVQTYTEQSTTPKSNKSYGQKHIEGSSTPAEQGMTSYRCTSSGGKIYYSTSGCGSSNGPVLTPNGIGITLNKPFQDKQESASGAEACAWAKSRASKGGLSSTERRSARKLRDSVCR
nr:DUF4124 domain-containing protein [uncultured Methylophaga sp.]